ncbi:hypothetical protein ABPG72_002832 [Tetrahymena utriculariae]
MLLSCFCEKEINCSQSDKDLITHISNCNKFQEESPLAKEFNDIPLKELDLDPLYILRGELLGYLVKLEQVIMEKKGNLKQSVDALINGKYQLSANGSNQKQDQQQQQLLQDSQKSNPKTIVQRRMEIINESEEIQKTIKKPLKLKQEFDYFDESDQEDDGKTNQKQNKNGKPENKKKDMSDYYENSQPEQLDLAAVYATDQTICNGCKQKFDSNLDCDKFWFLNNCLDVFCKKCLLKQINEEYIPNKGQIKCKVCKSKLEKEDFENILGKEKFDKLDTQLLEQGCDIVACIKCNQKFDFQQGDPNSLVNNKDGKLLDKKLLQHYSENRFVCQNVACKTEQCRSCKSVPYHLGYECSDFQKFQESKRCRYCNEQLQGKPRNEKAFQDICNSKECSLKLKNACNQVLNCGHPCCGIKNELKCLPCLFEKCAQDNQSLKGVTGEEYCNICFIEGLINAPVMRSKCGHIFHYSCLKKRLEVKWLSPRIVFNFCLCPLCKQWMELAPDSDLYDMIEDNRKLFNTIKDKSIKRLKHEGREKDEKLIKKESPYFEKPVEYAMAIYSYYMCYKCKAPYFGGLKDCERALNDDKKDFQPKDLICPNCCEIPVEKCKQHGTEFIEFKCRYCCSIAVWFCFGTTHFCEPCHNNVNNLQRMKSKDYPVCKGKKGCPFQGEHNPNGQETPLGCSICRNIKQSASEF